MFERVPYIVDILVVVVVVQSYLCFRLWGCCRKADEAIDCCRKADEAWRGAKYLFEWGNSLKLNTVLECMAQATGCRGDDPTWPPEDPGEFPGGGTT